MVVLKVIVSAKLSGADVMGRLPCIVPYLESEFRNL